MSIDFISNIAIEVTRKCQLNCAHCLRGKSQNININNQYIYELLQGLYDNDISYISTITFTGGEPSLNYEAIEYTLSLLKKFNISLGSFYIATNAINIPENFVITLLKLFSYCDEKDLCSIQLSNDKFHDSNVDLELLEALKFFTVKNVSSNYTSVINQGNAEINCIGNINLNTPLLKSKDDLIDMIFYLNCKGFIIKDCNWSYKSQNRKSLMFSPAKDFAQTYINLYNKLDD